MSPTFLFKGLALAMASQGSSGTTPLDLATVIRETRVHSTEVRSAQDEVRSAKARISEQDARRRPQLSFLGNATRYDNSSDLRFGGQQVQVIPDHLESLTLQLNQILDFSNQLGSAVSQAKLFAISTEYGLTATEADVSLSATTAYYDLIRSEKNVEVASASLNAYMEQLKLNMSLFESGIGQKIDVLRARSQVADAQRELVRRQNEFSSARSHINDLLGRSLDEETTVLPAAGSSISDKVDRPSLIRRALDHRSEILAAETEVRAAQKGIKLARTSTDPQFIVGLAGNYYPQTSFQEVRQSTAALTFGLTIPIYEGGLAQERVREARAIVDSAKAHEDRVRRDIALQVQNAALDVETAGKRLDAANVAVLAATGARDLALQRHEAQVGLYLEVTDAQAALTQAQGAQVDATYDLLSAQARLTRALGEPLVKMK